MPKTKRWKIDVGSSSTGASHWEKRRIEREERGAMTTLRPA